MFKKYSKSLRLLGSKDIPDRWGWEEKQPEKGDMRDVVSSRARVASRMQVEEVEVRRYQSVCKRRLVRNGCSFASTDTKSLLSSWGLYTPPLLLPDPPPARRGILMPLASRIFLKGPNGSLSPGFPKQGRQPFLV